MELINMEHPLGKLAGEISWDKMEQKFAIFFHSKEDPLLQFVKLQEYFC
jgi:hypothetical protein